MSVTPDPLDTPAAAPLPGGVPTDAEAAEAASVVFTCQRCGRPMPPMDGKLAELARSTAGVTLAHDVCPDADGNTPVPAPEGRHFAVRCQIVEVLEHDDPDRTEVVELMAFRGDHRAPDLDSAMRPLAELVGQQWAKAEASAKIVDQDTTGR